MIDIFKQIIKILFEMWLFGSLTSFLAFLVVFTIDRFKK